MAGNDALVQRIVDIIKSHVNSKQALANLSRNQNLAPAIVEIIKRSIPEAPKVVAQAPSDDVVRAIVNAIKKGVPVSAPVVGAAITSLPGPAAAQVVNQVPTHVLVKAITNAVKKSIPQQAQEAAVEKLTRENQTSGAVQAILNAFTKALTPPTPPVVLRPGKPEGAIGQAYYAGKRRGWVFGTPDRPMFRLRGQTGPVEESGGWRLRFRDGDKYDFYYVRPTRPSNRTPRQPWTWPSFSDLRIRCLCSGRMFNQTF
jgi:hypothetical protein